MSDYLIFSTFASFVLLVGPTYLIRPSDKPHDDCLGESDESVDQSSRPMHATELQGPP